MSGYKFKILLICLLAFNFVKGQVAVQRSSSSVQVMDSRLKANLNLGTPHYADTTSANVQKGLDSLGNIISTGVNPIKFWIRDSAAGARHWTQVQGSGGGSGLNIYNGDSVISGTRTVGLNNFLLQFTSTGTNTTSEFDISLTNSTFSTGTFFSRGISSGQSYASSATTINGTNENATYAEMYGSNSGGTHTNRIRTYPDSLIFNSYNGTYRFRNAVSSTDTVTYKPFAIDAVGNVVRFPSWASGQRTLFSRNGLRARNDSTITWNGLLDTITVISGSAIYPLKFSGILGGVKFDENPTFNTISTTGQVWTAANSSGLGQWQTVAVDTVSSGGYATKTYVGYKTVRIFNVDDPAYGGTPDGVEVMNAGATISGSTLFTCSTCSFTTAMTGKVMAIDGAGNGGGSWVGTVTYASATTLTLSHTATSTLSNKRFVYGTDNTTAIQSAINACYSYATSAAGSGGGKVWIPRGFRLVNGALQSNFNSQLTIPGTDSSRYPGRVSIIIEGEGVPNYISNDPINSTPYYPDKKGTVILSTLDGAGSTGAAVFATYAPGTSFNNINYSNTAFRNLTILVIPNWNGTGPSMGGINGRRFSTMTVQDIKVEIDGAVYSEPVPTTTPVAGVMMPQVSDELINYANNILCIGMTYGFVAGEHTEANQVAAVGCYYGIVSMYNNLPWHGGLINSTWCHYPFYVPNGTILGQAGGISYFSIEQFESEQINTTGIWVDYANILLDAGNFGHGSMGRYMSISGRLTEYDSVWNPSGGANIISWPITNPFQTTPAGYIFNSQYNNNSRVTNTADNATKYASYDLKVGSTLLGQIGTSGASYSTSGAFQASGMWISANQQLTLAAGANIGFYPGTSTVPTLYLTGTKIKANPGVLPVGGSSDSVLVYQASDSTIHLVAQSSISGGGSAALTATYVGYGSGANVLAGTSDLTYTTSSGQLQLTKNQNAATWINITNNQASAGNASSYIRTTGQTYIAEMVQYNGGTTAYGAFVANASGFYSSAPNFVLMDDNASGEIDFAVGSSPAKQLIFDGSVFKPAVTATNDLGTSSLKWRDIYTRGIVGTTTNDNAQSGSVGQFVSSLIAIGGEVTIPTASATNITSISLTAGDWDVQGQVNFDETGATVAARTAGISSTSATIPSDGSEGYLGATTVTAGQFNTITISRIRFSLSGTTTVYLIGSATFSTGTVKGYGNITARRVR